MRIYAPINQLEITNTHTHRHKPMRETGEQQQVFCAMTKEIEVKRQQIKNETEAKV